MVSKKGSIKKEVLRGSLWTMMGHGAGQVLRFANNIILASLLAPESFGLMVLINSFLMGVQLFTDIGIGQSVVQNPRGEEPDFYNTAWTIQVIRGVGLFLICLLLTYPVSKFYDERLLYLFPIASVSIVINSLTSNSIFILQKRIQLAKLNFLALGVQFVSIVAMVLWALVSPGVMALIFGNIVGATVKTVVSHFLAPDIKHRFRYSPEVTKEIVSFGRWIFLSAMLIFLARQGDRLVLGRLVPLDVLGIYGIARALSKSISIVLIKLGNGVIFPAAAKMASLPRPQLRKKIQPYRAKALILSAVFCAVLITCADGLIRVLFDERYQAASEMLPVLVLGVWLNALFQTVGPLLKGLGKPQYEAIANFVKIASLFIGLILGAKYGGLRAAIFAIPCSELLAYLSVQPGLIQENLSFLKQDLYAAIIFMVCVGVFVGLRNLLLPDFPLYLF